MACQLVVNHWRPRKTGPEHPLLVMTCRTHKVSFTLYPHGHVPYGRTRVAPVAEDGAVLSGAEPWRATLFDAVLDAADDVLWPCDSSADDLRRRRTQVRRLERAEPLLGLGVVASFIGEGLMPELHGLGTLTVLEAGRVLDSAVGVHARGLILGELLDAVPLRPGVLDAVLFAGAAACLWGTPIRWEPARRAQGRRRFLFPYSGTPP